ncbi:MAG: class I SAM-dependent methyltransferase [Chloroflexota bacterium]
MAQSRDGDDRRTRAARARYDRIAPLYDLMEAGAESGRMAGWRSRLWAQVKGPRVLEAGVGTGKNIPYYPPDVSVTAIDFSPRMLERARQRAEKEGGEVDLRLMDAQHLEFPDGLFDTVVATFVFCSVPDPVQGLRELGRVTKPGGRLLLLEHVRPTGLLGNVADAANPVVVRVMGANINRRTVENLGRAGLIIEDVQDLWRGIVKLIFARPGQEQTREAG